jgi:hypothetical protein
MKYFLSMALFLTLLSCSSGPVAIFIPNVLDKPPVDGSSVYISESACGYQLFDFIPIFTNDTLKRALRLVQNQAYGSYVESINIEQYWYYGLIGTVLCTRVNADVIKK